MPTNMTTLAEVSDRVDAMNQSCHDALVDAVSVKIVVAFSYAALADVDEMFASAGGFNQTSPI